MEFYAIAHDRKGINYIVNNLPKKRIEALQKAQSVCKKKGLVFEELHFYKKYNNDNVLTKFAAERKTKRRNK